MYRLFLKNSRKFSEFGCSPPVVCAVLCKKTLLPSGEKRLRKAGASVGIKSWNPIRNKPKTLATQSELGCLGGFELELQLVRNQGDELGIGGLALGVGYRIAEEALEGVQIPSVPGDFNGMADGPLHPAGGGAEGLGHLGIQHLGDGVACLTARWGASKRENLLRCL